MDESALIRVESVSRSYGRLAAVQDLSFALLRGQVLGLLGPNGAGKSTTLQMVCGALAPSCGDIFVDGLSLVREPLAAKQRLGYLADTPPAYPEMRVAEYLSYCARLRRVKSKAIAERVAEVVERCGLGEFRRRLLGHLSKGMLQRVGIAQSIVHLPRVVVLDEPTIGLDPLQIVEIRGLIRQLGDDFGVLMSTHILPEVEAVCDRAVIINRGQLVFDGPLLATANSGDVAIEARFARSITEEQVTGLDGVVRAKGISPQHWQLFVADEAAAQQVLIAAATQGWGVQSWQPLRGSIEQLFMDIVARDGSSDATHGEQPL